MIKLKLNVKYHDEKMPKLEHVGGYNKSDFIDLRCVSAEVTHLDGTVDTYEGEWENFSYKQGDVIFASFGVSIDFTSDNNMYTGQVFSRSSLFKNFGLLLTNGVGVIDNSYSGNNDVIKGMFLAMREGSISKYERMAQLTVIEKSPKLVFVEVENLGNKERQGYGSTGVK